MRSRCLIFIIGFLSIYGRSQDPSFRVLSTDHGLASRTIYDIQQHINGKIFIGHELGLSVYNGMEVLHYQNNYKTTPLSNLTLFQNEIICRNFYGEIYLTQQGRKVRRLEKLSQKGEGICTMIQYKNRIFKKSDHEIIVFGTQDNIEKSQRIYQTDASIIDFLCFNDKIYVLTSEGVCQFPIQRPFEKTTKKIKFGIMPRLLLINNKPAVYSPDFMKIIVNPHSADMQIIDLKGFNIDDKSTCVKQLRDGNIYIGTFGGLYIYKQSGELIRRCYKDIQVSCIFQDIESNIWLGTIHDGIRIISDIDIHTVFLEPKQKISKLIVENDDHLLLGTFDGKLYRINSKGEFTLLKDFERNNEIQSIHVAEESIWLYCVQLYEVQAKNNSLLDEMSAFPIKSILSSGDTLYCGTSKGVQLVVKNNVEANIRRELWVKKVIQHKNNILFETSGGIMCYKNQDLIPVRLSFEKKSLDMMNASNLIAYSKDYYFSLKNVVYKVDEKNRVSKLDCSSALHSISKIAVVNGRVFATDGKKIIVVSNNEMEIIDETSGVVIKEINDIIGWNNQLVIIGSDRFQIFPIQRKKHSYSQTLSLTKISGTFKEEKKRFVSNYKGNNLIVKFDFLPNISSVGTGKVYYRLKGVANEWKPMEYKMGGFQIDERRIPYGATTLEVYGVNQNNKTRVHRFSLYVFPPYYLRWWFILIVLFCVTFIVYLIYRQRILVINRKNRLKMEQERLKTKVISSELKALRSQMNPHFIFNSLSSIQSKILNDETKEAYSNLSAFSKLLRQSLKFTGEEFISLENEIDFLKNYVSLEQGRLEKSFEFKVEIDADINIQEAQFPSLFSQPFVENSIRHGLAHKNGYKELQIKISGTTTHFCMVISDNGIGRSAANQINQSRAKSHESFATQAMKDRIEMINANGIYNVQLEIHDKSVGTEVLIAIQKKNG